VAELQQRRSDHRQAALAGAATPRALLLGVLASLFVNLGSPYTETTGFSNFSWSYLPEGAAIPFLALVAVNALVHRVSPRRALTARELLVVFIMALVANATPLFLCYFWLSAIVSPHYFASPENRWEQDLTPHINPALIVSDERGAVLSFYEGVPGGQDIAWRAWVTPVLAWMPLILAILAASFGLAVLFRKQWLEREKLTYPLMQLPLELVRTPAHGERPIYRRGAFWIGVAMPFALALLDLIRRLYPPFPAFRIDHLGGLYFGTWQFSPHYPSLRLFLNPLAVGFGYFVPTSILLSVWLMYLLVPILEVGTLNRLSLDLGSAGMFVWGSAVASWQCFGAFTVLVGTIIWAARGHLRAVARAAFGRTRAPDASEPVRAPALVALLAMSFAVAGGWLLYFGMTPAAVVVFLPTVFVLYLGLAWIICQSGIFYLVPPTIAQNVTIYALGPASIGRDGMIALGLSYSWHGDVQTVLSVLSAEAMRVQATARVTGREFTSAVWLSVLPGLLAAIVGIIATGYIRPAITWNTWVFRGWGPNTYGQILGQIHNPQDFDWRPLVCYFTGAALMVALTLLHHRFVWWPVHPLGLVVASSFTIYSVYLGFLLAWVVKVSLLRWAGARNYRRGIPLFIGLIAGHYVGRALSLVAVAAGVPRTL
jgi:hypothetical protein